MNWRDPPLKEHQIKTWCSEHAYAINKNCAHCDQQIAGRYIRTVWATKREIFVRAYHPNCA